MREISCSRTELNDWNVVSSRAARKSSDSHRFLRLWVEYAVSLKLTYHWRREFWSFLAKLLVFSIFDADKQHEGLRTDFRVIFLNRLANPERSEPNGHRNWVGVLSYTHFTTQPRNEHLGRPRRLDGLRRAIFRLYSQQNRRSWRSSATVVIVERTERTNSPQDADVVFSIYPRRAADQASEDAGRWIRFPSGSVGFFQLGFAIRKIFVVCSAIYTVSNCLGVVFFSSGSGCAPRGSWNRILARNFSCKFRDKVRVLYVGRLAPKWDTKVPGDFSLTTFEQKLLDHLDWNSLMGRRNQDFYCFKISQMHTKLHLRKNDVICAFREFTINFIRKWKPHPSHKVARHKRGSPMRRNRELGVLFHNLSASDFFSWLLLFSNRL